MPVAAVIEGAAQSYRYNDKFLVDSVNGLSDEEWHRSPSACTNHMGWIVGHLIWARKSLLSRLGRSGPRPGWGSMHAVQRWTTVCLVPSPPN